MHFVFFRAYKLQSHLLYAVIIIASLASAIMLQSYSQRSSEVISRAVAGKVIVIDAGHGGFDPGVIGYSGAIEKHINLAIAQMLEGLLLEGGATVIMTRNEDSALGNDKQADLAGRVKLAEENAADIYISIHCNALEKGSRWRGAQSFFASDNEAGRLMAQTIQKELQYILKNTDRVALRHDETYILKNLKMPAAIIEVGFLSNIAEEQLLLDRDYQWKVAWAIMNGIGKYFSGQTAQK